MRLEPPGWWYGSHPADRLKATLLAPAGFLYGTAVKARFALTEPYRSRLPVICIGNFTVGGAGKTPLALAVANMLRELGLSPAFLTRGYGGRLAGPNEVDPERHQAIDVGDEPLLLARAAPTFVSRNRREGAKAIEASGASVIIMDDGFQNPSLAKDLALIAVDGDLGLGNGRVFPAGPLRAPLAFQIARAQAAILIGRGANCAPPLRDVLPLIKAEIQPAGDTAWLRERPILAFSGIGHPEKFFKTLREMGAQLVGEQIFPDHHPFTEAEALSLMKSAAESSAQLVTTEKDWVRIPPVSGPLGDLKAAAHALLVRLAFDAQEEQTLRELLLSRLDPMKWRSSGIA